MAKKESGFDRTREERRIFHTKLETTMRKLHESESDVEGWFIDWERFRISHNSGRGLKASDSFKLFGQYLTGFRRELTT